MLPSRCRSACYFLVLIVLLGVTFHNGRESHIFPASPERQAPLAKIPNQWFMNQRLSAGPVPVAARAKALEAWFRNDATDAAAPGVWVEQGPFNVGGRVPAMDVDPNDPDRIWLGSANGGLFLSEDAGVNWTPLFDDQSTLAIGAIAAHPVDSGIVYVGTGEDNGGGYSYAGDGVYKTVDGGATWTNIGLAETRRIGRIVIDPVDPERVFVAAGGGVFNKDTNRGVYRSIDGGQTWEQVLFIADDTGVVDITLDKSDPNRLLAAAWQRYSFGQDWYVGGAASGIYRSLDGGDTWTKLGGGLPTGADVGRIGVDIAESNPNTAYAVVINSTGGLIGIYRTQDFGTTWTKRSNSTLPFFFSGFSYYFGKIVVDPNNANTVYTLDQRLWKSTNGATSSSGFATEIHVDHHALTIGPGARMYSGNDGGFYSSFDGGANWTHSQTLSITQLYDIGIDTLDPNRRFVGAQDNGTNRTTTGGLGDWQNVLGGDGMECEVDPTDSNKVYAESQFGNINRSVDGGDSFVSAQNGIDSNETANWVTPIALDPTNPAVLYTGRERVYRSEDSAVSWTAISPVLPGHADVDGGGAGDTEDPARAHTQNLIRETITVVRSSAVDDRIIWAGTDDGHVWVTDDLGTTWNDVTPPGTEYWVTDIAPDPFDARQAYLTVTGYRQGDRLPYVRKTSDLGATWQEISAGLPQVPTNTVIADPEWRGQVFVGTDLGMYLTDDGGATWQEMNGGMPRMVVLDLFLHATNRTLYLGSHARGLYSYDLSQLPVPDRDNDGVVNVDDCAPEDAGAYAEPAEVTPLDVGKTGDVADLSWPSLADQAGSGTLYDVARDLLSTLRADGGTAAAGALACGLATTNTSDAEPAPAGDGFYYLVRGKNVCAAGPWGSGRTTSACP